MASTQKRWHILPRAPEDHFARFPDLPRLVVQVLYNRGIREPREVEDFLSLRAPDRSDPFELKGMAEAVDCLRRAVCDGKMIAVYGDYDVDGVTATALMVQTLTALGGRVRPYIPNRFDEGYGLNEEALSQLAEQGVGVVLTVDCGIRSIKEILYGNRLGLEIIVTDHHFLGPDLPLAVATINPKQPDCAYPFKKLAGVGLAFKLAQALLQAMGGERAVSSLVEEDLLDLVALGTVADLAPLTGENRFLVARGLQRLKSTVRPGMHMLMTQAGVQPARVDATTIGFVLGPRLNAAGRLESAQAAYELLITEDVFRAGQLAQQLDGQNRDRQLIMQATIEQARRVILEDEASHPLYLITDPAFNTGVVGLVSGRLTEEFYRPTLVAQRRATDTKGSARSIPGFHITQALDECADLLVRYGGHSAAAGFTLKNEDVAEFERRLLAIAERELAGVELIPTLEIDAPLNLRGIKRREVEDLLSARAVGRPVDNTHGGLQIMLGLEQLHPFGESNRMPIFFSQSLEVKDKRLVGGDGNHLKLVLSDGRQIWDAIAFRMGSWYDSLPAQIDLAFTLEVNEWNGRNRLQLNVKDIRAAREFEA